MLLDHKTWIIIVVIIICITEWKKPTLNSCDQEHVDNSMEMLLLLRNKQYTNYNVYMQVMKSGILL